MSSGERGKDMPHLGQRYVFNRLRTSPDEFLLINRSTASGSWVADAPPRPTAYRTAHPTATAQRDRLASPFEPAEQRSSSGNRPHPAVSQRISAGLREGKRRRFLTFADEPQMDAHNHENFIDPPQRYIAGSLVRGRLTQRGGQISTTLWGESAG